MEIRPKSDSQKKPVEQRAAMSLSDFLEGELPVLADVVSFCNNLPISLYADTTVVKSPEAVFRGILLSHNRLVAEEYLLNCRRSAADLGTMIGTSNYALPMAKGAVAQRDLEESEDDLIPLPRYENERAPIGPVIRSRRSVRRYSGNAVSLQELSTLLFYAAGISGQLNLEGAPSSVTLGGDMTVDLRVAASGGALYPIELWLLALHVDELLAGAYRYLPRKHALKRAGIPGPVADVRSLGQFSEIEVEKAGFLIGYVYNLFENTRKYGEAGLSFALMETGAIAAHVHLLCTALGLGSCDVGAFSKRRCERVFDADGLSRHMLNLTVVGR